jgi:hypothetical protein
VFWNINIEVRFETKSSMADNSNKITHLSGIWEPMNNNRVAFELKEKPVLTTATHETMALNNCESKHKEM